MNLRYSRLLTLATGALLVASSAFAANLTVEPTVPSSGSMIGTDMAGGPVYVPGPIDQLTPGLDAPGAIECNSFDTSIGYTGGFLFIPPDPYNAAGPAHVEGIQYMSSRGR